MRKHSENTIHFQYDFEKLAHAYLTILTGFFSCQWFIRFYVTASTLAMYTFVFS